MPVTEQDYRNILARMRVDPLFRNLVVQVVRENVDTISAPLMREVDLKLQRSSVHSRRVY